MIKDVGKVLKKGIKKITRMDFETKCAALTKVCFKFVLSNYVIKVNKIENTNY